MSWITLLGLGIQMVFLILNNYLKDKEANDKKKEEIHAGWQEALRSGDHSRINAIIDGLRK